MFQNFSLELGREVARHITYSLIIVVLALIARITAGIIISVLVNKVEDSDKLSQSIIEKRAKTLAGLAINISNILILVSAAVMIMSEWGINIAPIITGVGILGLAVGFGTQRLVQDVVTGAFILFENQYNVGDTVKIAGQEGVVKEMNLRTTILMGEEGQVFVIPNSQVTTVEKLS